MVSPRALWVLAIALVVCAVAGGCVFGEREAPPGTEVRGGGGTTLDPPAVLVDEARRFGSLAPFPAGTRVLAIRFQEGPDDSYLVAAQMAAGDVDPFLGASGMLPYASYYRSFSGRTAFGSPLPAGLRGTDSTRITNSAGQIVYRAAAAEPRPDGSVTVHIEMTTT